MLVFIRTVASISDAFVVNCDGPLLKGPGGVPGTGSGCSVVVRRRCWLAMYVRVALVVIVSDVTNLADRGYISYMCDVNEASGPRDGRRGARLEAGS